MEHEANIDTTAEDTEENRYSILNTIGMGGSAYVFKAYDSILEKIVCLKVGCSPAEGENLKDVFYRFEKEARILSSMNHPNIVQCYELTSKNPYGENYKQKETPILVLQFVEGIDLYNYGREYDYEYARIVDIAAQIARALNYAHSLDNRVIHRDIKGTNIIINNEGHVYLIDFGISKLGNAVKTTMHRFGTSGFIAPEILQNYVASNTKEALQIIDGRTDLYSLGCLLYFLLTKKLPFPQKDNLSIFSILEDQKNNKYIPIDEIDKNCPIGLKNLIHKLMSFNRDARYDNCKELLIDLHHLTKKLGPPEKQFLDLDYKQEKSPEDFSSMKNNYDVFVRQNNEEKIKYFKNLDKKTSTLTEPKVPQRFDKAFLYSLIGIVFILSSFALYYLAFNQKQQNTIVSNSISRKNIEKPKNFTSKPSENIKKELEATAPSLVTLNEKAPSKKLPPKKKVPSYSKKRSYRHQSNVNLEVMDFGSEMTLNKNKDSMYNKKYGVQESRTFSAILLNKIITSDINAPVTAILNEDIIVNGKVIVPSESKIIGTARGSNTDRVAIRFKKFILNNGKSISFSGIAMDSQGATGISGKINREQSKKLARRGGNVLGKTGNAILSTMTNSSIGGQILDDAGNEVVDQINEDLQYRTQSTTVIEVQSGAPFKIYISREF